MMVLMPIVDLLPLTSKFAFYFLLCENECGPFKYLPLASGRRKERVLLAGSNVLAWQALAALSHLPLPWAVLYQDASSEILPRRTVFFVILED